MNERLLHGLICAIVLALISVESYDLSENSCHLPEGNRPVYMGQVPVIGYKLNTQNTKFEEQFQDSFYAGTNTGCGGSGT